MTEPLVSIEEIKRRARAAVESGELDCPFPADSAAAEIWLAEVAAALYLEAA